MKISLSIDLSKIDRNKHIKTYGVNQKKFLKLTLVEQAGKFGDDGFAAIYLPKDDPNWTEKSPICGNWRYLESTPKPPPPKPAEPAAQAAEAPADDDIPF